MCSRLVETTPYAEDKERLSPTHFNQWMCSFFALVLIVFLATQKDFCNSEITKKLTAINGLNELKRENGRNALFNKING